MTDRLRYLFARYTGGNLSDNERTELMGLWLDPSMETEIRNLLNETVATSGDAESMTEEEMQRMFGKIFEQTHLNANEETPVIEMHTRRKTGIRKWMAAASILLLLATGSYFLFFHNNKSGTVPPIAFDGTDIQPPDTTRAMITLANGRKVSIDSLTMINDGAIRVTKNDKGEIVYDGASQGAIYNTIDNPRGSPVANITLIDGTKVWLNTASSLKYFASNTGKQRQVEINGEAYFEVAKDASRPFIVKKATTQVTVLGTHFNVDAYDDQSQVKITLLEGSVRTSRESGVNSRESVLLKPNEQAIVGNTIDINKNADIDAVMAWKNGLFAFNHADIPTVMRQVSRWYDVDVRYEGGIPAVQLGGDLERNLNLQQVLKALEKSKVRCRIEG
ncbi:MAG TPA: FecR domain-containing protein, partial [Chitinophagaceae bacterium]|nr:FecR domain-containing protein [Chitinophagaceae bacterium]